MPPLKTEIHDLLMLHVCGNGIDWMNSFTLVGS